MKAPPRPVAHPSSTRAATFPLVATAVVGLLAVAVVILAAVTAQNPTVHGVAHAPPAAFPTMVPLAEVQPATTDISTWQTFNSPDLGLTTRYPADWSVLTSPVGTPSWVTFYPPDVDPSLSTSNVSFLFDPGQRYPTDLPGNIVVAGIPGHESEIPPGKLGYPGGYQILLPYRTGTLTIGVSDDLRLKSVLKAMLTTLMLRP